MGVEYPLIILVTGFVIALMLLTKTALDRTVVPALVGYLVIGFLLGWLDQRYVLLAGPGREVFEFLAKVGLVVLLFKVGLESNIQRLLEQLRRASMIWGVDVILSGLLGYVAAAYVLGLDVIPSLVIAVAFTATSVGVSVSLWHDAGAVSSPNGALLLDVAELDDVSAVVLMALLLSLLPVLHQGGNEGFAATLLGTAGIFAVKLVGFAALCLVFAYFLEAPLTTFLRKFEQAADFMLVIAAIGFVIAALAGLLGFSLAIGAFFAGLVFSRDPRVLKCEGYFTPVYELFAPFFFIGIGMDIDPLDFTSALGIGAILLMVAVAAKLLADGVPVYLMKGFPSAALIGVSMVPRAEITMVVAKSAHDLGSWALPSHLYGAMVVVSAGSCIVAPLVLNPLLRRWPQTEPKDSNVGESEVCER